MKTLISSEYAPTTVGPYSPGLSVGEWIFLSGQGGFDPTTGKMISDDIAEQTAQTFRNIEVLLEAADVPTGCARRSGVFAHNLSGEKEIRWRTTTSATTTSTVS
jgi:enamine deaminase RidA (YjgF/YER057c/UK114 family)